MSLNSSIFIRPAGVSPMLTSIKTTGRTVEHTYINMYIQSLHPEPIHMRYVKNANVKLCADRFWLFSYFLPHLPSGWHVDEAIKSEEDRVVVIRFGHDWDSQCMTMDETLYSVAEKVQNFAVVYLVDITEVPDFNKVSWLRCSRILHADWVACGIWRRCMSCMIHAWWCSSIGEY